MNTGHLKYETNPWFLITTKEMSDGTFKKCHWNFVFDSKQLVYTAGKNNQHLSRIIDKENLRNRCWYLCKCGINASFTICVTFAMANGATERIA